MNRINHTFKQGKVFAAYITAGDGSFNDQLQTIRALLAGGVTLLEIGVPFSDPIADGLVIQRAMERALNAGTTLLQVFEFIRAIRQESEVPIILFTYYNPILCGGENILLQAKEAGVDGILVIDFPFFEAEYHLKKCADLDLAPIAVITSNTSVSRLKVLVEQGKGFLYYACRKGTTGARKNLPDDVKQNIDVIREFTHLPIIIGFGIADPISARTALNIADGFVVGSHFIDAIDSGITPNDLRKLALSFGNMIE